jgi:hypothetical protein
MNKIIRYFAAFVCRLLILSWILASILALIGCQRHADYFKRQEEALISLGYRIQKLPDSAPTEWEKKTFNLQVKRSIFAKGNTPVPGTTDTYYRYTLTEEEYPDEEKAKYRLDHLFEKPPDFDKQNLYNFTLRKGYQHRNRVYVIGTDAAMFESEMEKLAEKLQSIIDKR